MHRGSRGEHSVGGRATRQTRQWAPKGAYRWADALCWAVGRYRAATLVILIRASSTCLLPRALVLLSSPPPPRLHLQGSITLQGVEHIHANEVRRQRRGPGGAGASPGVCGRANGEWRGETCEV